jgi:ADP-dependent NAD(P)H-hydrate dehydratase / NAD(P)H-hydrate epimerase
MSINAPSIWLTHFPQPTANSNKYTRGSAAIYGGYPVTGAARLAALACAKIGAGLTSVLVSEKAFTVYASSLLSVMVKPYQSAQALNGLLSDSRISTLLIGPGAGINAETKNHALAFLATHKPIVLDADAISVFEGDLETLKNAIQSPCVLTPHEGEFARLMALPKNPTAQQRQIAAQLAAKTLNAVVVLKGFETIIAAPNAEPIINQHASPYLATAGSGDVLAGMITGLLAQGMPPQLAAAAAVWMHGECAIRLGAGLIAEDLSAKISELLAQLLDH